MNLFNGGSSRWINIIHVHECDPPKQHSSAGVGSKWKCYCGKIWTVTHRGQHKDYYLLYWD